MRAISACAAALLLASCGAAPRVPAPAESSRGPTPITFPRLTEGDVTASVKLLSYDRRAMSVVVEPIIFRPGREFCTTYGVDPLDRRCSEDYVTEGSKIRVTLAVDEDAQVRTPDGTDCVGEDNTGTCPVALAELAGLLDRPAEIAVYDATITRVAVHYLP